MKTPSKLFIVTTILLFSFSASSAQDRWQVILNSGDTLTAYRLDSLHENVLNATCNGKTFSFPVDSIAALAQHKEGPFWVGALVGTLVGGAAGFAIGDATIKRTGSEVFNPEAFDLIKDGLIGGVGGFIVGGVIGASSSGSETYDLKGKTLRVKLYIIEQLLSK